VPRIDEIVFWAGGVLTQRVAHAAQDALWLPPARPPSAAQLRLAALDKELCNGTISPDEFCLRAAELAGASTTPAELAERIEAGLDLLPGMLGLVDELAGGYRLRLLADYPRRWLLPVMQRTGLGERFAGRLVTVVPDHTLDGTPAALFAMLVSTGAFTAGSSLLVDDDPARCMAAVRAGLDAAIFVDARRLRRDLGLWSILPLAT
jgi:FMN phosphatase YigB (HAD superfamily)